MNEKPRITPEDFKAAQLAASLDFNERVFEEINNAREWAKVKGWLSLIDQTQKRENRTTATP